MPYHIRAKGNQFCIHKGHTTDDQGELKGACHSTRDDAIKQLRALYAAESDKKIASAIAASFPDDDFYEEDEPVADVVAASGGGNGGYTINVNGLTNPTDIANAVSARLSTGFFSTNTPLTFTAHAAPPAPPAAFFTDPNFTKPQRYVTITADGRFMTHIALWGECHVGYGDICVSPPREADYSHFTVGTVLTSDGSSIPTGVIAITGGHADVNLDASTARSRYDDTATGKVDVVIGTDEFGIWASGAMRPYATEEDVHTLRASGVSGDWRSIDGELRLIGICAVNIPGFPKLSMAASADEILSLVAAGGRPLPDPDCNCGTCDECDDLDDEELIASLSERLLASETIEELIARIA